MEHETTAENIHPNVFTLMFGLFQALLHLSECQIKREQTSTRQTTKSHYSPQNNAHGLTSRDPLLRRVLRGRGTTNRP